MEKYNLKIHIGVNDLFNSSMNNLMHSKTHFINIIFTFSALILLIYLYLNNMIYNIGISRIILLALCIILFPIIQPLIIYIKLLLNYNKYPLKDVELKVFDDKLLISNYEIKEEIKISDLNDVKKYNNMIVIMYDNIHGQIIPNEALNGIDINEFYLYLKNKIKKYQNINYENKI